MTTTPSPSMPAFTPGWSSARELDPVLRPFSTNRIASFDRSFAPDRERILGTAAADILRVPSPDGESALGDFVADAMCAVIGTELAVVNDGALRADIPAGAIR